MNLPPAAKVEVTKTETIIATLPIPPPPPPVPQPQPPAPSPSQSKLAAEKATQIWRRKRPSHTFAGHRSGYTIKGHKKTILLTISYGKADISHDVQRENKKLATVKDLGGILPVDFRISGNVKNANEVVRRRVENLLREYPPEEYKFWLHWNGHGSMDELGGLATDTSWITKSGIYKSLDLDLRPVLLQFWKLPTDLNITIDCCHSGLIYDIEGLDPHPGFARDIITACGPNSITYGNEKGLSWNITEAFSYMAPGPFCSAQLFLAMIPLLAEKRGDKYNPPQPMFKSYDGGVSTGSFEFERLPGRDWATRRVTVFNRLGTSHFDAEYQLPASWFKLYRNHTYISGFGSTKFEIYDDWRLTWLPDSMIPVRKVAAKSPNYQYRQREILASLRRDMSGMVFVKIGFHESVDGVNLELNLERWARDTKLESGKWKYHGRDEKNALVSMDEKICKEKVTTGGKVEWDLMARYFHKTFSIEDFLNKVKVWRPVLDVSSLEDPLKALALNGPKSRP